MTGKLFVISGSSGVGKGTLLKIFLERHKDFELSVSCTTRKPRHGEIDGKNYFFISEDEFDEHVAKNDFLEWAIFSENKYGTLKSYVEKVLSENKNIILEIDTKGALQIKSILPETTMIFISPPSFEELENRLRGRQTENEDAIQKRLQSTKLEIEQSSHFDYKIINDDIEKALQKLEELMCK